MSKPKKDVEAEKEELLHLSMGDEDYDAMMKGISDEEMLAYMHNIRETILQNPEAYPGITEEILDDLGCRIITFQKKIEISKAADRELEISTAKMNRSADKYLAALNNTDKTRGH